MLRQIEVLLKKILKIICFDNSEKFRLLIKNDNLINKMKKFQQTMIDNFPNFKVFVIPNTFYELSKIDIEKYD